MKVRVVSIVAVCLAGQVISAMLMRMNARISHARMQEFVLTAPPAVTNAHVRQVGQANIVMPTLMNA